MRPRLALLGLIISSLFGYLEWGGDNHAFLYQTELDVVAKLFTDPVSVLHPFTLVPLAGQVMLVIAFFQKKPYHLLVYIGIGCIGILFGLMMFIGLMEPNWKIVLSVMPFWILAFVAIRLIRQANAG